MTYEEAIKELKEDRALYESELIEAGDGTPDGDLMLAIDMAMEALEKQIPKKPKEKYINSVCIDWKCPVCGRFHRNDFFLKFCSDCGQAIDWSEEDE